MREYGCARSANLAFAAWFAAVRRLGAEDQPASERPGQRQPPPPPIARVLASVPGGGPIVRAIAAAPEAAALHTSALASLTELGLLRGHDAHVEHSAIRATVAAIASAVRGRYPSGAACDNNTT